MSWNQNDGCLLLHVSHTPEAAPNMETWTKLDRNQVKRDTLSVNRSRVGKQYENEAQCGSVIPLKWRCFYVDVSVVNFPLWYFYGNVPLAITSFIIRVSKEASGGEIFNWNQNKANWKSYYWKTLLVLNQVVFLVYLTLNAIVIPVKSKQKKNSSLIPLTSFVIIENMKDNFRNVHIVKTWHNC